MCKKRQKFPLQTFNAPIAFFSVRFFFSSFLFVRYPFASSELGLHSEEINASSEKLAEILPLSAQSETSRKSNERRKYVLDRIRALA